MPINDVEWQGFTGIMMLSLVKEHQNKTNLTTGVMSTEESTLATLFSTLWARASLRKERLKTPLGHSDKTFAIFILFWFYLNGPRTATGGFCLKLKYKKMRKRVIFFATNHNPPIICFVLQLITTYLLYVPLPTSKLFTGTQLPAEIIVSVSLALASWSATNVNTRQRNTSSIFPPLEWNNQFHKNTLLTETFHFSLSRDECVLVLFFAYIQ